MLGGGGGVVVVVAGDVDGAGRGFQTFFLGGILEDSGLLPMRGTAPAASGLLLLVNTLGLLQGFEGLVEVVSSHWAMAEEVMRRSRPVGLEARNRPSRMAFRRVVWWRRQASAASRKVMMGGRFVVLSCAMVILL